ncbi:MAG: tetratricopeptide repeat protein [Pyrinomonadaceae bacterium]
MSLRLLFFITISLCVPAVVHGQSPASAVAARSHVERFSTPQMLAERAETDATSKLATNPDDAEALNSRALTRMRLGRYNEAHEDLRRAIALKPTNAEYQANLGYVLWKLGRATEAISAERAALKLDDKNFTAHYQLGRFLLLSGDPKLLSEAAAHLRRALEIDPRRPDVRFDLLTAYRALGETAQAIGQLKVLKDVRPSDTRVTYAEALLSSDRGDMNAAIDGLREAVRLDPTLLGAWRDLGLAYIKLNRWAEAVETFAELTRRQTDSVEAAYLHALALYNARRFTEAESAARRALRLDASATAVHTLLDMIRNSTGANVEPTAARTYTAPRSSVASNSQASTVNDIGRANDEFVDQDAHALFKLATELARNGQYERAARLFTRVNELLPHTFEVLYNFGVTLYNLNRNDEAARALAEAADLNPSPADTHFWLAMTASARNDHANAIEEFKHAIEREPNRAEYHYLLGGEYFRSGFWDGAIEAYTRAIALDPKRAAYVLARAHVYSRKAEVTSIAYAANAAADFETAAALDPKIENIEFLIGHAHFGAMNFDRARTYLERVDAKDSNYADALAGLGHIAIERNRLAEAEALLTPALALAPDNVLALYDYARLAVKRRDYAEAVKRLEQVIAKFPTHAKAHYQLMLAYRQLGQADKAQAALAEFKRLKALEEQVHNARRMNQVLRAQ